MAGLSKNQLINWLNEAPRTMGWGAIMAFNRTDANTVLLQEYIQRFSKDTYLPPIQGFIPNADNTAQYLANFVMDYPRLSFESSNQSNNIPDASLTMKAVGGQQITFERTSVGLDATRIAYIDPLANLELTMGVELVDAPGTVNSLGQVVLDISKGYQFRLNVSEHLDEQIRAGMFFQALFEKLPVAQRTMVISEIAEDIGGIIKPASLKLRTAAAPGAASRAAANYGDGAVLIFVALEGQTPGDMPGDNFPYLIPNDDDARFSATILIGQKTLWDPILLSQLANHDEITSGKFRFLPQANGFVKASMEGGIQNRTSISYTYQGTRALTRWGDITFGPGAEDANHFLHFWVADNRINIAGKQHATRMPYTTSALTTVETSPNFRYANPLVRWDIQGQCAYVLNRQTQQVEPVVDPPRIDFSYEFDPDHSNDTLAQFAWMEIRHTHFSGTRTQLDNAATLLADMFPAINMVALHSLLFQNSNSVVLEEVALPGDMAVFGKVGPTLTSFKLDPQHPVIGTGDKLQFNTLPGGQAGLTWKVENILGSHENPGSISAEGLYEAPASLEGTSLRIKVTATAHGASSSALVSVVVNDITVTPSVQTLEMGGNRLLSAGSRRGGTLSWSLANQANGGRIDTLPNNECRYYAPPMVPGTPHVVDEVVVSDQNGRRKTCVMVAINSKSHDIVRDTSVSLPANQVKLQAASGGVVYPDEEVEWHVIAGSGVINNGLFSYDAVPEFPFAVIQAIDVYHPTRRYYGYVLLPLPVFDYPDALASGLNFQAI